MSPVRRILSPSVAALLALACEHASPPATEPGASVPSLSVPPGPTQAPASGWLRVLHGALVEVEVERAVYDAGEPQHFYVRVRVRNLTPTPVAIDLRARRPGLYVNQWEVSDLDHRTVIDEGRAIQAPLDNAARTELRAAMPSGGLTTIPAAGALELYGSFNASGRPVIDATPGRWLVLAVDGRVAVTDGARVDDLRIGDDEAGRVVAIPTPLAWRPLPAGAHRLPD